MKKTGLKSTTLEYYDYFKFLDFLKKSNIKELSSEFDNIVVNQEFYKNNTYFFLPFKIEPWTSKEEAKIIREVMAEAGIENGVSIMFWISW